MFRILSHAEAEAAPQIYQQMLEHRATQFVDRLKWPLSKTDEGFEIDAYDRPGSLYCVVERNGRHAGSLRLRAPGDGIMTEDVFEPLWLQGAPRLQGAIEVTRFCVAPHLAPDERTLVVADLLLGLCRYCLQNGIEKVFGVVFPAVARVIRNAGWQGESLAVQVSDVGRLVLMEWHASEFVAWDIQERASDIVSARRGRMPDMPVAA